MPAPILAFTGDRATRRQISRALSSGGMEVHFPERSELPSCLSGGRAELVILDGDGGLQPGPALDSLIEASGAEGNAPALVLLAHGTRTPRPALPGHPAGDNVVAKHAPPRSGGSMLDERELLVTCQKVLRRDIFGLEKYVGGWGLALHEEEVRALSDKEPLLHRFERFLEELDCPRAVVPDIVGVAEELILNAIVHAPTDPAGAPKYERLGPAGVGRLEPGEYVHVRYGCDGQRLMLSVQDNFGTLERKTLHGYLDRVFAGSKLRVEDKPSGAGLGLSLSFLNIHQLVFNVQAAVRTEAIAGWYLRVRSAAEFRAVRKSLNLFWLPAEG